MKADPSSLDKLTTDELRALIADDGKLARRHGHGLIHVRQDLYVRTHQCVGMFVYPKPAEEIEAEDNAILAARV